jgi:hypothetical protein
VILVPKSFNSLVLADPINLRPFPPCIPFSNFFTPLFNGRFFRREVDLTAADVAKDRISPFPVAARPNNGTPAAAARAALHPLATGLTDRTRLGWCET